MTLRHYIISLTAALSIFMLPSCHTSRKAYSGNVGTTASNAGTEQLYASLAGSYSDWTSLYVPIQIALESPKKMAISGRATMVYGQDIYMSLRMLGMEVAQIYINADAIYVVDKFHKYYFKGDLKTLLKDMDWTICDLQDLLLGRAVVPGNGRVKTDDKVRFSFLSSDDQWILTPDRQYKGADWHYIASKTEPPLLTSVSLRLDNGTVMQWSFSEPTNTVAGIVDGISRLTVPYKDQDIKVSIVMDLGKAEWDTDRKANFSMPSSQYKRLDVEALLKAAENL